jgi:hypothetical protein
MKFFQREKQHIIVFIILYMYQSFIHIEIMIRSYGQWGAEITAFTMNLVCRLISLAICFRDGSSRCEGDNDNDKAVKALPPLYKVVVYTFNVPSCIASPFYEYKDFEEWIELRDHYQSPPNPKRKGLIRFFTGFCWLIIIAIIGKTFNIEALVAGEFCGMPWYK